MRKYTTPNISSIGVAIEARLAGCAAMGAAGAAAVVPAGTTGPSANALATLKSVAKAEKIKTRILSLR
jgi:hypothetical protein